MRNITRNLILISLFIVILNNKSFAQNSYSNNNAADTTAGPIIMSPVLDSSLINVSIFDLLNDNGAKGIGGVGNITISQSNRIPYAFLQYISKNETKKITGYRIRIFFDNKQSARYKSEEIKKAFENQFPDIPAYLSISSPYFKVAVGNFRTRSDAMKALQKIKPDYPQAFITPKESIEYPAIEQ